jgi:hypothetical protein
MAVYQVKANDLSYAQSISPRALDPLNRRSKSLNAVDDAARFPEELV